MTKKKQDKEAQTIETLREELKVAHEELARTNSELLQLTLELDDRVEKRTKALAASEAELRKHRDQLQELVKERTYQLEEANSELEYSLQMLKTSEQRYESLVKTIPDIVYHISPQGIFTFINESVFPVGVSSQ